MVLALKALGNAGVVRKVRAVTAAAADAERNPFSGPGAAYWEATCREEPRAACALVLAAETEPASGVGPPGGRGGIEGGKEGA